MAIKRSYRKTKKPLTLKAGKKKIVKKAMDKAWANSVKAVVKKTLSRMAEVKEYNHNFYMYPKIIQSSASGLGTYNTTLTTDNLLDLSPSSISSGSNWSLYDIYTGVESEQRTGQKIRVKSAKLNLIIRSNPYEQANSGTAPKNTYPCPFVLKLFLFKDRKYPVFGSGGNLYRDNFLQYGSAAFPFSGTMIDTQMKMDPAEYQYCGSRTYKIGNSRYDGGATLLANQTTHFNHYSNNDFKYVQQANIDLTKDFGKVLVWDDGDEGVTNKHLFMLIQVVPMDENLNYQNTPPTWTLRNDEERLCEVHGHISIKYTDL